MNGCPSEFALERLRQGELAAEQEAAAKQHLETCPGCSARLAALATPPPPLDLDAVLSEVSASPAPREAARRAERSGQRAGARPTWTWRRRLGTLFLPGFGLAGVVAAAVLWGPGSPHDTTKGSHPWSLRVLVKARGSEHVEEASSGARLAAGDRLRFEVRTSWARGYVAVLGLDSGGVVAPWAPAEGAALEVEGGKEVLLEGAIELDASTGTERVELVACREPRDVGALAAEARRALARAHGDLRALPSYAGTCERETFWIEKVKP